MITDADAVIECVNPAFSEITGYTLEEVVGKNPSILKSTAQDPSFYKALWESISSGHVWHGTLIDRRKDGSFYPALMSVAPIHDDSGKITHYVSNQKDMTEYQHLEEQSQKMEAIGTLVGGIAHDFNNMLAAIQGNTYLANTHRDDTAMLDEKLANIQALSDRAAGVVRQLLTFAREDRVEKQLFSMNAFIKEAIKLAKNAIPENIALTSNICQQELFVYGDTTQLQQVLMNLMNNARDALFSVTNPQLSCELSPFTATEKFNKQYPELTTDQFARLKLRDNGSGISQEHLDKIFEPFFTTKGVGQGTGLGLAMVFGAVKSHGGLIEATSKLGAGTLFSIYLPLSEQETDNIAEKVMNSSQGEGELILLVDDEQAMRSTTADVLRSLGYNVVEAVDGLDGLEQFKRHQGELDLLITDVVMPKVGGVGLVDAIRLLDHDFPVIFATGYDMEHVLEDGSKYPFSSIISKPFPFDKLSQLIRKLLMSSDRV